MLNRFHLGRLRSFKKLSQLDSLHSQEPVVGARVVCLASGKGGTGKSVVATNLALLRARMGERVLLVDFDAGLANQPLRVPQRSERVNGNPGRECLHLRHQFFRRNFAHGQADLHRP